MTRISETSSRVVARPTLLAAALLLGLSATPTQAYEVWMGTHRMSSRLSIESTSWARTAAWVDGVNFNISPNQANPATIAQREDVIRRINHVENTIVGVPRPAVSPADVDEASRASIANRIDSLLRTSERDGAQLNEFMLYDARHSDGVVYNWTHTELQIFREELDNQGQQDARIIWRATNGGAQNLNFASLPFIDGLLIEASADRFINNRFNVNTLAQSFWNSSVNGDKELYMQIPRSENSQTQYEATREAVIEMRNWIGIEGVRSDRLVVMPVTYNENIEQLPETINNGNAYPNTMPGIQLSLIEQRPYLEGRLGELPAGFAASTERFQLPASIASVADGSLRRHKSTNAVDGANLGFVLNDTSLAVGQTGSAPYDRAAVIPFQLPNFGAVDDPFWSVHFEGFLTQTVTQDGVTAALYGLDRRPTAEILDSDYYGLSGTPDPAATLLQSDFLVPDMDLNAPFYSNSGGNRNLLSFLNEQYAGGAGAGEYVFLRASTNENSSQMWSFASGNNPDESLRPQLRFIAADIVVPPAEPSKLIAGWDTWGNGATLNASETAAGITGVAVTTSEGLAWHTTDGRGASADGDWGTFEGPPIASTVAGDGVTGENLELPNATTGGTITFTIANNGATDLELDGFHFDTYAFRPKAARVYELSVLAGGAISDGVIYTSADDEITHVGGAWDNLAHNDISHSLLGLADNVLEVGGTVDFLLAFSSGVGDGSGGHDLWIDNVAITALAISLPGDFNGDGVVDAADYAVWRDNLGDANESAISFNGDGGGVSPSDYDLWRGNYGRISASLTTHESTVAPEPANLALVCLFSSAWLSIRHRRTRIVANRSLSVNRQFRW